MGGLAGGVVPVDQWRDFFMVVGSGAAALTGLIFVAMSLNVSGITANSAHRYRAIGNLIGLTSVFMLSALILMGGQNHWAIGTEVLVVSGGAGAVTVWGHARTRGFRGETSTLSIYRTLGTGACYTLQVAGGWVLTANGGAGFYLVAIGIVSNFSFLISGAWLVSVGASSRPASSPGE